MHGPYPHPIIAREGWPFVIATATVSILSTAYFGFAGSVLVWIALAFVVQFFRGRSDERGVPGRRARRVGGGSA